MRLSLRTKLLGIALSTALAFILVIVASAVMATRLEDQLGAIEAQHIPRLALGPQLDADFSALQRGFQDAVAANDAEALERTRAVRDRLVGALDRNADLLGAADAAPLRAAIVDYYDAALEVSRRMLAKESGEELVEAIGSMQRKQAAARSLLDRATKPDARALGGAFLAARAAQATGAQLRLVVTVGCLVLVVGLVLWISRGVVRSLQILEAGFERYGRGQFGEPIPADGGDELSDLATGANRMAERIALASAERERARWVSAGLVELAGDLAGELTEEELATRATRQLARYVGAVAAALYRREPDDALRLVGHCALGSGTSVEPESVFRMGEGLIGQAASGESIVVIDDVPSSFFRIRSGLGDGAPRTLVLVPLVHDGGTVGILELASFKTWNADANELLLQARTSVAVALAVARSRAETKALLARTQELAQRLGVREEELRSTNEELQAQQEELRQTNDELAQQAEELEAQRATLEEQTRRLGVVSAYKSQFLANMSHELRTPLNSMLLLSNLLAENPEGTLTDKQVEHAKTVNAAGRDLLSLINQVLDLAKVEAGKQDVRSAAVRLEDLAARVRSVFTPLAKDRGLRFEVTVGEAAPQTITTDDRLVLQVLTNLLGNAIKFTEHGEVALRIGPPPATARFQRAELRPEGVLAFAVSDTGPGIAPRDRERIFAPFEQLDATVGRRHGGTGLGLNIAREHAALLGGELHVESTVGEGSTFVLYLPRVAVAAEARRASSVHAGPPVPREGTTGELLLVEDDPAFSELVGEVIRGRGIGFVHAPDGATALRLARERRPDGIILDVRLPDVDGWHVMEELRRDPSTADIPVHVLSALDVPDRAAALGAVGYLRKPATRRELARVVEALAPGATRAGCRILVVEDDAEVGDSVVRQLTAEGLDARHVGTARDAIATLAAERFACVVLDLSLPDMTGLEVLETLQARKDVEMPAVVVYTGRALDKAETTKLEAYAEAVVLKEGSSAERLLQEVRLFVRRLEGGARPRHSVAPRLAPDPRLERRKILVVDDDMRTAYALSAALRAKGAEVFVAENGAVALEILASHHDVAAVLMDVMMPEMDGYEATRRIRSQPRFAQLPIVALTAKAMKGDEEKCLAAGATDYLTKPVDADRLLAVLQRRLSASV